MKKKVQLITDDHIKLVDEKASKEKKDNMNPLNHVAIIMDGNGRWGLKYKKSETKVIKQD